MGCRASREIKTYPDCVRAIAGRMASAPRIDKNDAARLLVFFEAPANVVARAMCSNYVCTHEHEWRSVAKRLLTCSDHLQAKIMAPMICPIYHNELRPNGVYFRDV